MTDRDDRIRQAELAVEAMERDGMKACEKVPPEQPPSWDKTATLTDEQKAEPYFVSIARVFWRAGRGYLIPWLWDRYRDGQMMGEAYRAVTRQKTSVEPRPTDAAPVRIAPPVPTRATDPRDDWMTEFEREKDED